MADSGESVINAPTRLEGTIDGAIRAGLSNGEQGVLRAYLESPAAVLRCPACSGVVMRMSIRNESVVADVAGLNRVETPRPRVQRLGGP